jgi:pimeloyl-ACP methyl ester carboxylesterase
VLLPGRLGEPAEWQALEAELQGRGHSTRAPALSGATLDDDVAFLHGLVSQAGKPTVLVGHGVGGVLVTAYAVHHPDSAAGLATIATLPGPLTDGEPTGSEPRLAILCEDDDVIPYTQQQEAAALLKAPTASVPGGHTPHIDHPALVATLLLNWLTLGGA